MGQPISCDFCGTRIANLMIGNLDNGQQIAVCYPDTPAACEQLVAIAAAAVQPADVPVPDAPATQPEDNGAGAQPAPRPPEEQGETPASAGADDQVAPLEVEAAAADAS